MILLQKLFMHSPYSALFITVALGYWVGKIKLGNFVLGGIAGTLLMGVAIGQFGVTIDSSIKEIFFALFIYAVGYQGGAKFFNALSLRTLKLLIAAFVTAFLGLLCMLVAAWLWHLDRGTAAGLAAGALTQSSMIGTAGDAIAKLPGISEATKHLMQTNVAVGYAVTYIFGSLGPVIIVTWFIPMIMRWDIRKAALKAAKTQGEVELEPGQFNAVSHLISRAYRVQAKSLACNQPVAEINEQLYDATIEVLQRAGKNQDLHQPQSIKCGDVIVVTSLRSVAHRLPEYLGQEITMPQSFRLVEESRQLLITQGHLINQSIRKLKKHTSAVMRRGIFFNRARRDGKDIAVSPDLILKKGDQIEVVGTPEDLNRVQNAIGYRLSSAQVTDFIFFGLGINLGMLLGLVHFTIMGIPITLGSGIGCLTVGLVFGWLHNRYPRYANLPLAASTFLRDFGLAVFVGVVGLQAGPQAVTTIQQYGVTLLFLGMLVTLLPQLLSFLFAYYCLGIKHPIEALGCLMGGKSANPGFAALLGKAGNATPVFSFTVCYAFANVLLTLWGPIIVGIISTNAMG